jgi:branched-chain amino acid transport system ATP-binding protein
MFLDLEHLTMRFGGVMAVNDVTMSIERGEIHGLIGPNGSGKTTIFNVVSGYYKPTGGRISFEGALLSGLPAHQITGRGIARTFQNLRLFKSMTVLENVLVGMERHTQTSLWQAVLDPVATQREDKRLTEKAMSLLNLLGIAEFAHARATSLPYGNQRRVEIARALATDPKIVLLDEPASGLNETETDALRETLLKIRDSGVTIFIVEHDMKLVKSVCDLITVLDYGKKIAEGCYAEVSRDQVVIEAYLGKEEDL